MYAKNGGSCMLKNGVMYATIARSCMQFSKSCMPSIHEKTYVMYASIQDCHEVMYAFMLIVYAKVVDPCMLSIHDHFVLPM